MKTEGRWTDVYVRAPVKCIGCVFLSTSSGKPFCPFGVCIRDDGKKTEKKSEKKTDESGGKKRD